MRTFCVTVACLLFSACLLAQKNNLRFRTVPDVKGNPLLNWHKQPANREFNIAAKDIARLPLNNMPCFVPDLSAVAAMPVTTTTLSYQFIPNPYFTYNSSLNRMNSTAK